MRAFCDFVEGDSGQDLIEYALLVAMLLFGAVAGIKALATAIGAIPNELVNKFINAYNS